MYAADLFTAFLEEYGFQVCACGYWTTEPDYFRTHVRECATVAEGLKSLPEAAEYQHRGSNPQKGK